MRACVILFVAAALAGCQRSTTADGGDPAKDTEPLDKRAVAREQDNPRRDQVEARKGPELGGISAEKEGVEWGHRNLAAHLEERGIKFQRYKGRSAKGFTGSAMRYSNASGDVSVQQWDTAEQAKAAAAGGRATAFAWGRFYFEADTNNDLYRRVCVALP